MAGKFIYVLLAALLSAMLLGGCGQDSGDSEFYTVRMPADYDGLVFCASPSPYNFEEFQTFQHEREGYVTGVTLEKCTGIDEDNALFCRI